MRFRHLVSRGNNRRLTLASSGGSAAAQPVEFPEPYRFDSTDTHTWAMSPPVLVTMSRGKRPLFRLGSDDAFSQGGPPTHDEHWSPALEEMEQEDAAEEGEATPADAGEEDSDEGSLEGLATASEGPLTAESAAEKLEEVGPHKLDPGMKLHSFKLSTQNQASCFQFEAFFYLFEDP